MEQSDKIKKIDETEDNWLLNEILGHHNQVNWKTLRL